MDYLFASRLQALRKEHQMTQERLAAQLGVTFQAVSKWENGQSFPDISLLPVLAAVFGVTIDSLLGYMPSHKLISAYEEKYKSGDYYWGLEPTKMCYDILKLKPPTKPYTLLDIGCGEGKDAVFFAKNGYIVSAFDIADAGLDKAKRLAAQHQVAVNFFKADLLDYRQDSTFDIVFSSGVLHYMPEGKRAEVLGNYQAHTAEGGLNAFNVFVKKPFIADAPDREPTDTVWRSGELFTYYHDWLFHQCSEDIFDCDSSGVGHKHCMDTLIAEKVRRDAL